MVQDKTDITIQNELDFIAELMQNNIYSDYCKYEDDVAKFVNLYCPTCKEELSKIGIGITIMWTNIRNYIRQKANILFV